MAVPKTNIPVVLGCMTIGNSPQQSRITDLEDARVLLDIFQKHGHTELDTSRVYGGGSSEEYLGNLNYGERGILLDTKYYPSYKVDGGYGHLTPDILRENLLASLKALKAKKVNMYYLHGPDRETPLEVTLRAVNDLHKEGHFDKFGISNYMSWEVAEIQSICRSNGWIAPVVYQGLYNCVHRSVEAELLPCLRHYGMGFYSFNPLGGGFFVGHLKRDAAVESGSRFDPNLRQGAAYRQRYWNDAYFDAMDLIRPVAEKHDLTLAEVALRWMTHHSRLGREFPDTILIGASSTNHLEANLVDLEKGPLPVDVLETLEKAWSMVKGVAIQYYH